MPAFVKSRFGASGSSDDDGTMVCFLSRKKSRNDCRISAEVIVITNKHEFQGTRNRKLLPVGARCADPRRCSVLPYATTLAFLFVQLRFDERLDFVVKRL